MRPRVRYVLALLALLLVFAGGFLIYYLKTLGPRLKDRVVSAMEDRFDAHVRLSDLQFSFFPVPSVDGEGLVIKHRKFDNDQHPLIRIRHFHAETDYSTLLDWRNHVNKVVLEGLEIHVPARGPATLRSGVEANQEVSSSEPGHDTTRLRFLIATIIADNSLVEIEPKRAGNDPLLFPIQKLTMHSVGNAQAMTFSALLKNALPPGAIDTAGNFGPWQRDDPRATPVSGNYTFNNANLCAFKGISGTLSSTGRYGGVLQHINVDGTTDTPDFSLKQGGAAVHLTTRFHSVVDGTNGDTILDPVDAEFGRSEFLCTGGILQLKGHRGKTVNLDARTIHGRMEDILALIVTGPPMIRGGVSFHSRIVVPPGQQQIADKLELSGGFHLTSAIFTSEKSEERLRTLSDRASGVSKAKESRQQGTPGKIAYDLSSNFKLYKAVISLTNLAFSVPGAHLLLAGRYNTNSSQVDMQGRFQMRATLSETQSGIKSLLLKPLDPMFRKNGAGFEVPITIAGTREHPAIAVTAFHRTFTIH